MTRQIDNPPSPPFRKPKVTLWSVGKGGFETYFLGNRNLSKHSSALGRVLHVWQSKGVHTGGRLRLYLYLCRLHIAAVINIEHLDLLPDSGVATRLVVRPPAHVYGIRLSLGDGLNGY